jgi:hypothetical protein
VRRARELVLPEGRCMVKVKNPAFWEQCAGVKTVVRTTTQDMDAAQEVALQYAVPARAASVASKVRVLASASSAPCVPALLCGHAQGRGACPALREECVC